MNWRTLFRHKTLWAAQLAGNLALAALIWGWLNLTEATTGQLIASVLLGLAVVVGALWLHGATLAAFRAPSPDWPAALRRTPLLFLWTALVAAPAWFAGSLPGAAVALLVWLPLASVLATRGARLADAAGPFRDWKYYAGFAVAMLTGVYLPLRLIWWIPLLRGGVRAEAASLVARFLAAYLLATASWMLLAALAGGQTARDPAENHRQTVLPDEAAGA
jgi:hypothetical protein